MLAGGVLLLSVGGVGAGVSTGADTGDGVVGDVSEVGVGEVVFVGTADDVSEEETVSDDTLLVLDVTFDAVVLVEVSTVDDAGTVTVLAEVLVGVLVEVEAVSHDPFVLSQSPLLITTQ